MPLLSALWGMALLSLVAISLLSTSAASYRLASNALEMARTDAIAEAAVARAVAGLTDSRPAQRWRAGGRPLRFALHGSEAIVEIQDEFGRIDLNYADREPLFELIRSAGTNLDLANSIVEAILAWRTPGGSRPDDNNASRDSASKGMFQPRHGPFQSVDELRLVSGVTPQLYRQIAPALTVYSQHQMADPQLAPHEVLAALPGMTPERVAQMLLERENRSSQFSGTDDVVSLRGHAFSLRIAVSRSNGKRAYLAVIRLTDDPNKPYWLLDWREGVAD